MTGKNPKQRLLFSVLCTLAWGLAAHGYAWFNLFYNFDSLLVYQDDVKWQLGLGRFLQPLYFQIRGNFYSPLLVGLLSMAFIGVAVFLLAELFQIQNRWTIGLISGVCATNLVFTLLNASFSHDVDIYALSFLMCTAAVYVYRKWRFFGFGVGLMLLIGAMGLYQSFFQVSVFLLMMLAVLDILERKPLRETLLGGAFGVLMLLIALAAYAVIIRVVCRMNDMYLAGGYNGVNTVGRFDSIQSVVDYFTGAYRYAFRFYQKPIGMHTAMVALLNKCLLVLLPVLVLILARVRKVDLPNTVLLIGILLLMPFGMNLVFFLSKGNEHELMTFSFCLPFVFDLILLRSICEIPAAAEFVSKNRAVGYLKYVVPAMLLLMLADNIQYSNAAYLKKDLEYQATMSIMTRVVDKMEETEGYELGKTRVAIVGNLVDSKLSKSRKGFSRRGMGMFYNVAVNYYLTMERYMQYVLGYPINLATEDESWVWGLDERVIAMPDFPAKGSVQMVDDVLIVKLANNNPSE